MEKRKFEEALQKQSSAIDAIRMAAHALHDSVAQVYDQKHPYWYHLDMVADCVMHHAWEVCESPADILPIVFGAYFHDSIEDARLTYNNVRSLAEGHMSKAQALMAAEIVYALTNEKGRTRAERANDKYYQGIRSTPYAPLVKLADRYANTSYSFSGSDDCNRAMRLVYASEMDHFLQSISDSSSPDKRLLLPAALVDALRSLVS